jgi:hypothetical protein
VSPLAIPSVEEQMQEYVKKVDYKSRIIENPETVGDLWTNSIKVIEIYQDFLVQTKKVILTMTGHTELYDKCISVLEWLDERLKDAKATEPKYKKFRFSLKWEEFTLNVDEPWDDTYKRFNVIYTVGRVETKAKMVTQKGAWPGGNGDRKLPNYVVMEVQKQRFGMYLWSINDMEIV